MEGEGDCRVTKINLCTNVNGGGKILVTVTRNGKGSQVLGDLIFCVTDNRQQWRPTF